MTTHLYRYCCSHVGKYVRIRTRDGRVLSGRMVRVSPTHIHVIPSATGVSMDSKQYKAKQAVSLDKEYSAREVFWFPFIVPLAAIIGLTIIGTAPFWGFGGYGGGFGGGFGGFY